MPDRGDTAQGTVQQPLDEAIAATRRVVTEKGYSELETSGPTTTLMFKKTSGALPVGRDITVEFEELSPTATRLSVTASIEDQVRLRAQQARDTRCSRCGGCPVRRGRLGRRHRRRRRAPRPPCDIAYSRSPAASRASLLVAYSLTWRILPSRSVNTHVSSCSANAAPLPVPPSAPPKRHDNAIPGVDVLERQLPGLLDRFVEGLRQLPNPLVAAVDASVWKVRTDLQSDVGIKELEDRVPVHLPVGKQLEHAAKKLHVLLRHGLLRQPDGFEGLGSRYGTRGSRRSCRPAAARRPFSRISTGMPLSRPWPQQRGDSGHRRPESARYPCGSRSKAPSRGPRTTQSVAAAVHRLEAGNSPEVRSSPSCASSSHASRSPCCHATAMRPYRSTSSGDIAHPVSRGEGDGRQCASARRPAGAPGPGLDAGPGAVWHRTTSTPGATSAAL